MPHTRPRKVKLATLMIVGEGAHDCAFLKYLKQLYDVRESGQKVTIQAGDGGSPSSIINATIRKSRHAEYDRTYILLDEDVEITQQDWEQAKRRKIVLLLSTPVCLEGMLLELLGHRTSGYSAAQLKANLHPLLCGAPTDPQSYIELFPKHLFDSCKKSQIIELKKILANEI